MRDEDGMTHVPFVQGMTIPPHTAAHAMFIIPAGFYDHPIPKWMAEHPGEQPSRRTVRRIMREARKAGWDSGPYEGALREMKSNP